MQYKCLAVPSSTQVVTIPYYSKCVLEYPEALAHEWQHKTVRLHAKSNHVLCSEYFQRLRIHRLLHYNVTQNVYWDTQEALVQEWQHKTARCQAKSKCVTVLCVAQMPGA